MVRLFFARTHGASWIRADKAEFVSHAVFHVEHLFSPAKKREAADAPIARLFGGFQAPEPERNRG
jgi:hypothetical protein